jgi:transcriptional regulator with XRE-family HTH domain
MGDKLKETTSKRIKELRTSHKYTMEKLADMIGVSKSTIAKWENGYVENMRQDNILKLATIFSVPATYIMGYDDSSESNIAITNELTDKEKQFVSLYSRLSEHEKIVVDKLLQSLSGDK